MGIIYFWFNLLFIYLYWKRIQKTKTLRKYFLAVHMRISCHSLFITASAHDHLHTESWVLRESEDYWSECFYWFEFVFEWRLHVLMLMMNYQPGSCFIGCRLLEIFSSLIRIMFDQLLICESCCFCDSWADERSLTKHQIQSCSSIQTHALFISQSYFTAMILISNKQFFITRSQLTALLWCFSELNYCRFVYLFEQQDKETWTDRQY